MTPTIPSEQWKFRHFKQQTWRSLTCFSEFSAGKTLVTTWVDGKHGIHFGLVNLLARLKAARPETATGVETATTVEAAIMVETATTAETAAKADTAMETQ